MVKGWVGLWSRSSLALLGLVMGGLGTYGGAYGGAYGVASADAIAPEALPPSRGLLAEATPDVLERLLPDLLLAPADAPADSPRPGRRPSAPVIWPPPSPSQRSPVSPPAPVVPTPTTRVADPVPSDPAEEVAPAVIELPPRDRAPSPMVFLAMQQELKNLMGRFESALLMANSLDMSTTVTVPRAASRQGVKERQVAPLALHSALTSAQQLLEEWDHLLATGQHNRLRDRWVAARNGLWASFPQGPTFHQAEIRAIWLDRGTIVAARSPEGLAQVFDRLAAAGITTVFFETVNAGYPIYPSQVAPEQNPLTQDWDPLAAAVTLAHQRDMTLHAWVWVFAAGNQRHNRLLNQPLNYPGPLLSRHPDWAAYDNSGNLIPRSQDKPFLDPANPQVRSYLTRLMTEIVTNYGVDGVHLDYIRYPFQDPGANRTYGYGGVARWQFQNLTGVDPTTLSPRPSSALDRNQHIQQQVLWERWTDYRTQQVTSFVETLAHTLKRQRPGLVLSAAVFANSDHDRRQRIQQDWGTWARLGYIDWIVLMSYAADTSRFDRLVRPWLVDQSFGSTLVIPGIRLLNLSNAATVDQMQVTRDLPTPGYALFAMADLDTELNAVLAQTQGQYRSASPNSYHMALSRYQALQREWHWLLNQHKLWMDHHTLDPWVASVNRLGEELQTLAESPSRRALGNVKGELNRVRTPLRGALVNTANSAYRLQVWQHRLATIEQLLDYGDRSNP